MLSLPANPRWQDERACNGLPFFEADRLFFPVSDEEEHAKLADELYCRACPVRINCLASALKRKDVGVFAGTSTAQRKKLARTRNRAKCPVCLCGNLIQVIAHDICTACGVSWQTEHKPEGTNAGDDN